MSQPYKSGRQQNINLGINSITENRTVLQTIGKVGIGTTNAQNHSLFVVGSTNITGDIRVGGASTFVGVGTFNNDLYVANQLYVGGVNVSGGATVGADIITRNLLASGISTFVGITTVQSTLFTKQLSVSGVTTLAASGGITTTGGDLFIGGNLNTRNIFATGISTLGIASATTLFVTGVSTFSGITTYKASLFGTQGSFSGIVTANTFVGQINAGVGTVTNLTSTNATVTNINSTGISTLSTVGVTNLTTQQLSVTGLSTFQASLSGTQASFTGIVTANTFVGQINAGVGTVTNLTSTNATVTNINSTGISTLTTLNSTNATLTNINSTGISTFNTAGVTNLTTQQLNVTGLSTFSGIATHTAGIFGTQALFTGIVTANTFVGQINAGVGTVTNLTSTNAGITNINSTGISTFATLNGTNATLTNINSNGISTLSTLNSTNATITNINSTGISTLGVTSTTNLTAQQLNVTGLSTFAGITTVTGSTLFTKQFEVLGISTFTSTIDANGDLDVDGHTELDNLNVSGVSTFAGIVDANGGLDVLGHTELDDLNVTGIATIQSLDVQGEFDVYDSTAVFHNNLYVAGNLSIGGTTTIITAQDLRVFDRDIILGITTDAFGNDVSADISANHGGIAIASTEGSPLVDLTLSGFSSLPVTYKQMMWVAANSYGVGTTDAWMFNYAVGIGSTLVPNGVRFAVKGIQFTDDTISAPNLSLSNDLDVDGHTELDDLNVSGVSTFTGAIDANGGATIDNIQIGITNDNEIDTVTGNLTLDSAGGTVTIDDQLIVSGITTFQSNVHLGDNDRIIFGDGNDLQIFHDPTFSNSVILEQGSGNLLFGGSNIQFRNTLLSEVYATFIENGSVELYYDNSKKFETSGYGATVFGTLQTQGLQVSGVSTFTGAIDANGDLDVDGHTELDNVNISGFLTATNASFSGNVTIGGTLTYEDVTNIDAIGLVTARSGINITGGGLTVVGVSTLGVTTTTDLTTQNLYVSGLSTFIGVATHTGTIFGNDLSLTGIATVNKLDVNQISPDGSDYGGAQYLLRANGDGTWAWADVPGIFSVNNILNGFNVSDEGLIVGTAGSITQLDFRGNNIVAAADPQPNGIATIRVSDTPDFTTLNVSGLSTFAGITTVTGPTLFAKQLNVSGVSTFIGISTFVSDLFVGGNLFVKNDLVFDEFIARNATITGFSTLGISSATTLFVTGVSTFSGITTYTASLFGTQGSFSGIVTARTFNGQINSGVGTITNLTSTNANLTNINSTGISTFATAGVTNLTTQQLSVTGLSTFQATLSGTQASFTGIVTANTFVGQINAGVGTITNFTSTNAGITNINSTGISTLTTLNSTNAGITNINSTGISTLTTLNSTNANLTNINSTGIATLSTLNTAQISVSGVITAPQFTTGSGNLGFTTNTISGPSVIFIDPSPVGVGTTSGIVRILGDLYVDGTQFIVNSTTIELADFNVGIATTVGTNVLLDGAGIGIGSANIRKTITWNNTASALTSSENWNLVSGKQYEINGVPVLSSTTLGSGVVNSSLTSVGTLGQLNVAGIVTANTFVGQINAGVGTITSLTSTNAGLTNINSTGISTLTTLNSTNATLTNINSTGISTLSTANATNLTTQQLNVTGLSTFAGISTFQSSLFGRQASFTGIVTANSFRGDGSQLTGIAATTNIITNSLVVLGISTLGVTSTTNLTSQQINVTGLSTFAGITTVTGPTLFAKQLNVSGVSTFVGVGTFSGDLYVGGDLYVADDLIFDSFTAREISVTEQANLYDVNVSGLLTATSASFSGNINIDGYVGINSTTPNVNLDVNGDASISGYLGVSGILYKGQTPIYFDENNLGQVQIVGSGNNLKFYNPVFGSGGDWIFDTYSYGEVVRITNSGLVGIGTDSPQARAHIYGTGYSALIVQSVPDEFLVQNSSISLMTEFDGSYRIQTGTEVSGGFRIYDGAAGQERLRITSGFEGGNIGIGTTNPTEKLQVNGNISIENNVTNGYVSATTASTSQVSIHSALSSSTYRSIEYTIQATRGTNFHLTKILAVHDGTTVYLTEYGTVYNNTTVASYDVDISGGNLRLLVTPSSSSSTTYKVTFSSIKV